MNANHIGQPHARVDGRAKVTGSARYAADFNQPGQAYAVIVGASIGLGRVIALDAEAARRLPGVLAVLTHENAPKLAYAPHKGFIDPEHGERLHVLQDDHVRFYGQPVAVVVAQTLDQAEHAACLLLIRYAEESPVSDPLDQRAEAVVPEAGREPGPHSADRVRGDPEAALAAAAVSIDATYDAARENHFPIEPNATVAAWQGDQLTLWSKSQFVINEQAEIAAILGIPTENVHVICPFIGGAFGTSLRTWPHVTLAAVAAREVGKPVKLVLSRRQMFHQTGHRPRTVQRIALSATPDGRLTGIVHEGTGETSRHEQFTEALTAVTPFLYRCPNVRTRYRLVPLDIGTPTFMRGPGEATGVFALECAMDELAYALEMDPLELRRRNEPGLDEGMQLPFSSRSMLACYERGADAFGWSRRTLSPGSMRDGRLHIGWGMACASYPVFHGQASARVRLLADGTAEVEAAASDMGPGTYTSITQIAAETLGLPMDSVRFSLGRSDFPPTPPHGGSMTLASVGSAVRAACIAALDQRQARADRTDGAIEASATAGPDGEVRSRFSMHAFGAVFVEVAIDPDVGTIRVRRVVGAYGAGRIVNPRLAASQCTGGMVGGIGMALMERTALDPRDGRPVNAHMADYLVPVNLDIHGLEAHFVDEVDPHVNELGVKGLGEIALVGVAPAVANAVFHATGKRVRELPIRIEHLVEH
ncbi:Putative xanthine dehydrogenase subunit [Cupriavidus necator]|uniref:Putative xanthine dehydrogenase subunit n=1 Tax=Cupriavidus necator (strain ATCC 17699 / DSM 428 / KCTC 22496 / NCIMB 10442 / H16 / Stanier 337) TaxID=381666 RepID=Q0JZZ4_CUPNH|nr:xanthine dehydrogenase family protein molybdopterin-binding subunit [Cupriavidus necator]QCC04499.1 xanthine dehydrogenase family protein molybdopterin-binding subunit [Cupriavidus necator H16]QQB79191.1 xanthine dehydrogenase family protein molybdopterin-binding subunit [Cupriavidus necator]WKA43413.1 xanthine dehydrogenase family protein molybdopterin-binding subunit [Cupriavidus necator]CAJ96680.1 putative xanthine dehydrogenase subunit [Cupriavidus necator H16]